MLCPLHGNPPLDRSRDCRLCRVADNRPVARADLQSIARSDAVTQPIDGDVWV
jgi:hypothetical protein